MIVGGCRGDSQVRLSAEQQAAIVREAEAIFTREHVAKLEYTKRLMPDANISPTLTALGAERVWLKPTGLYVRMEDGFVSERGYYIPAPTVDQGSLSPHTDPSYIKVAENLYQYEYR
ncbi:hypothetical protein H5P28_07140 [Ruficoccus amylovorans]|uniref:Uncharacterized protein n=1 Tax=Ruficoccus amylovorans TaxID=1804625 RepID=A0A842HET1_9BACT|nr:hypothetical protein [Ruficoccus amylovorans]MBC2594034.1 hypothetical protein [Ruficoccus amylovorans]